MDDEFAAFEAEMSALKSEAAPSTAGPRAPRVISSAPVRTVISKADDPAPAAAASAAPAMVASGGSARSPVSARRTAEESKSVIAAERVAPPPPPRHPPPEQTAQSAGAAARGESALGSFMPASGAASALAGKHSALGWLYTGPEAAATHSYKLVTDEAATVRCFGAGQRGGDPMGGVLCTGDPLGGIDVQGPLDAVAQE